MPDRTHAPHDATGGGHSDRWCWLPVATLASFFGLILLCGMPGQISFMLIPLVVLGLPVAALGLLVQSVVALVQRRWRKAGSMMLAAVLPMILAQPVIWSANCVHLLLTAGFGMGQLGETSVDPATGFTVHDWSVGIVTNPSTFLLHDPTDELARPATV